MPRQLTIVNETKTALPRLPFKAIKIATLSDAYKLNLVIATAATMKKLNTIYRGIEKPTDILSFPLSKKEGDIYICLSEARTEAKKFDRTYENFLSFLFIHGCVHLKGYDHGGTMESIEVKLRKQFRI